MLINEREMLLLIKVLIKNGNLDIVRKKNEGYSSINESITVLENELLIEFVDEKYNLTEKGKVYVKKIEQKYKLHGLDKVIFKDNRFRIDKREKNSVYLSNNRD